MTTEILNVSKSFGETKVLDDVSLTIGENEFVVFLGPSGCGKSTLLRMIAGLESVDAGEIRIDGKRVDRLPPGERGVAMVFQHYALYPHMTVRDNMTFGLRNIGMAASEIERRIVAAAKMLEIEPLLERKPAQISGGQRQRVAIGRAIVKEPKLFLFDEPLSNLDAALRVRTRVEIAQLHQRIRAGIVFVTHDQVEAMTLAHRIIVMNNRRIEQVGTPMEIYGRPATQFVATFVGTPAMNFLPVSVDRGGTYAQARLRDGSVIDTRVRTQNLPDGAMKLGVRAEAVRVDGVENSSLRGSTTFVERLGDRTFVYVRLADESMVVAEAPGSSRIGVGENVGVTIDGTRVHLFDDERGFHADGEES